MRRREFIAYLSSVTLVWPVVARAQQKEMPAIGFLHSASPAEFAGVSAAFHEGLAETGYVEGRNVTIEYRWAEGQYDRLPALAADLVRRQVAVIATSGSTLAALAAKAATTAIPIVFTTSVDPIEARLVASLNRPGGNVTGVTTLSTEIRPKWLEVLKELMPAAAIVALLVNPTNPTLAQSATKDLQVAARRLGLDLRVLHASTERELDEIFAAPAQLRAGGLVIANDAFFTARSEQLASLTLRHAIPAIFQYREFAAAGGLMSYGGSRAESNRQFGVYIGRILKGEKPSDLPVYQATKVELVINLKTAKALQLTVPPTLLARADEVIE